MKKMSISMQIRTIFIGLTLVILVVTSSLISIITYNKNKELVMKQLSEITDLSYYLIDSTVNESIINYLRASTDSYKEYGEYLYTQYLNEEISLSELEELFFEFLSSQVIGETGYAYIIDSNGVIVYHPFLDKGTDISEYDFIQTQIEGKIGFISYEWQNVGEDEIKNKVLYMNYIEELDYIITTSSYEDEFIYLVNLYDLKQDIDNIVIGEKGYTYLMSSDGTLLIHPTQEGENIRDLQDENGVYFVREILSNKSGSIIYPFSNLGEESPKDKIVIYRYYDKLDVYICSGVNISEINSPVIQILKSLIVMFLIVLIIVFIVSSRISKLILYPIKKLVEAMKRINTGNFDSQIEYNKNDEMGELIDIFNQNISAVNKYMGDLKNLNLELENKVAIRTNELENLSNQDALTKLFNRRKLNLFVEELWNECLLTKQNITFIMMDIDNFKAYNDNYGHLAGDEVLIKVSEILKRVFKRDDDFISRFGGEEFLVVIKNSTKAISEKLLKSFYKELDAENIIHEFSKTAANITVSSGLFIGIPTEKGNSIDFINQADDLLYEAKKNGKNQVYSNVETKVI